jgi:hypothetical protein
MIILNLEVDGIEKQYNIPESWSEVTVGQAADIQNMAVENGTNIEKIVKILTILTPGISQDEIFMMSPEQFNQVAEQLTFIKDEIDGDPVDSLVIEGEEYFLKKDFTKLTMGEIISVDTIMKQTNHDITKALPKMLCIFLRKKKENGELESFKSNFMEREELFRSVIITDVAKLFTFFLSGEVSS